MRKLYALGPFRLDAEARALTCDGNPVALGARAVAVLATLVSRATDYVPKAEIMDAAWPGLVVEEANLAVQISAIRRVFAGVPGGEGWIETLARRGYRFVGPVTQVAGHAGEAIAPIDRKRSNVPQVLTSFVGREKELAEIKRLSDGTVPSEELVPRKSTLNGNFGLGLETTAGLAQAVSDLYSFGIPTTALNSFVSDINGVTDAQIRDFASKNILGGDIIIAGDYSVFKEDLAKRFPNVKIDVIKADDLDLSKDNLRK